MARSNFVGEQDAKRSWAGVQAMIKRLQEMGVLEPEELVDSCIDLLGPVEVGADTKKELVGQAKEWGQIRWDTAANAQAATKHTGELLQLIVATREYQFARHRNSDGWGRRHHGGDAKGPRPGRCPAHGRQRLSQHGRPVQQPALPR